MDLRVLNPDTDEHLFRQAWKWRLDYPRLVRRWDGLKHFRQWFALMKCRVSVGIFTDRLIAIATLKPDGNGIYEAHVDCERRVDRDALTIALLNIEQVVFTEWKAREIFVGVISRNCGIIRIAEACGFQRDGIEERVGKFRWIRMRITNLEYNQNRQGYIPDPEHLRQSGGAGISRHQHAA